MNFTVEVSNDIYPKQVILEARTAFSEYANFSVAPKDVGVVTLTIMPMKKFEDDSKDIALSFMNYALDLAAKFHLERE